MKTAPGGCGPQTGLLNRKITQVLMEVLIEREWIWWNEAAGKVATALGVTASVFREGRVVMEDGLRVWSTPSRVGSVNLPADGGGPAAFKINSGRNAGPVRLLLQCSGGVCRGSCFFGYTAENSHHLTARIIPKAPLFLEGENTS